jgi:hypothetical protein
MAQKRPSLDANEAPPAKLPSRGSSDLNVSAQETKLLRDKIAEMEAYLKDRGRKMALKQTELNAERENSRKMQADYEDQIKKLNTLLEFRV